MCGLTDADHTEYGERAGLPLIVLNACQVGEAGGPRLSGTMNVTVAKGSLAARIYGANQASERFTCSYELNREYESVLCARGLVVGGRAEGGRSANRGAAILRLLCRYALSAAAKLRTRRTPSADR